MTDTHLAQLVMEVWRASGRRTEERRTALLRAYAETYYGSQALWADDITALVRAAQHECRRRTRIDELQYD